MKNIIILIIFLLPNIVYSQRLNWDYLNPIKIGNYYGFENYKKEKITENIYDTIKFIERQEFNNELYAIYKDGKIGLINAYEKRDTSVTNNLYVDFFYIIEPKYDSILICSPFWNCFLNGKIEVIDMHNNQLFAPAKVNDACYVYIDISRYLSYSIKKRASWDSWNKDKKRAKIEKLRNEIKRKNDELVKINNNYANSYRSLILFGTKYYEVSYSYDNTFKKRQVLISKFLQKVIDDDKNKCQYLCKNILKM